MDRAIKLALDAGAIHPFYFSQDEPAKICLKPTTGCTGRSSEYRAVQKATVLWANPP